MVIAGPQARRDALLQALPGADGAVLARAPGRVNLIGEHTDYNQGLVMPLALGLDCWVAARPRGDRRVRVRFLDPEEERAFPLDGLAREGHGADYVKAVLWALAEAGLAVGGMDLALHGTVPQGAGLSSSAALELAVARAAAALHGWDWDPKGMARICQRAENGFIGVQCGIMDQMASAAASSDEALLLDCRDLSSRPVPIELGTARFVVVHSGIRRGLEQSQYNERRQACEAAVAALKGLPSLAGIESLRDVDEGVFRDVEERLPEPARRRARHVVGENARVLQACDALLRGDAPAMGALMRASHASLRDDYEVSSPGLDALVDLASRIPGVHGSRLTGAGFGGCTVHLVEGAALEAFGRELPARYREASGLEASVIPCEAARPAGLLPLTD